jgi:hypothetical protein
MPATPPRPRLEGEPQGDTTITLAIRAPERLRSTTNLAPKVLPTIPEPDPGRRRQRLEEGEGGRKSALLIKLRAWRNGLPRP